MLADPQTHQSFTKFSFFHEIHNMPFFPVENSSFPDGGKNPLTKLNDKSQSKHKTFAPSVLPKHQKIAQFQNLIHSQVPDIVRKTFIIQLYRGVKYSLKSLKGPSEEIIQSKKIRLKQIDQSKRKFLFLDLDQTLIYTEKYETTKLKSNQSVYKFHIRPYAKEFLNIMSKYYDLYVFTAATKDYAEAVIQKLNSGKKLIQDFLCRDHCFETQRGKIIKDLRIVENRSLEEMILIDNRPECFGLQIDNGIPILDFCGSQDDKELQNLELILIGLSMIDDVRKGIQEIFRLRSILQISKEEIQAYLKCEKSGNSQTNLQLQQNS